MTKQELDEHVTKLNDCANALNAEIVAVGKDLFSNPDKQAIVCASNAQTRLKECMHWIHDLVDLNARQLAEVQDAAVDAATAKGTLRIVK